MARGGIGRTAARRRWRGVWAAGLFAVAAAGVIGYFALRSGLKSGPERVKADDLVPRDITDLPVGAGSDGMVVSAASVNIQMEDPEDPGKLKGELTAEELDPQANHRYLVKRPEAWLYLKNGWMVYVRSDTGSFFIPEDQQQPEKGLLQGNVRCEGYAPADDGTPLTRGTLDRATVAPGMIATMDSMSFDATLGRLSTDGRVEVTSERMDFAGTGLTLVANQVRERLNVLDVARGEYLKYRPQRAGAPKSPAAGAASKTSPEATAKGAGPKAAGPSRQVEPAPKALQPEITMYAAEFREQVVIRSGDRKAEADRLDVWSRLVNNALPEGAIAELPVAKAARGGDRPRGGRPRAPGSLPVIRPVALVQDAADSSHDVQASEIVLTWTGPLRVRPLETEPTELTRDSVFLRLTAEESPLVRLADAERAMSGACRLLEYGATSQRLVLSGQGPASVSLTSDTFEAQAGRVEADLGLGTGRIPGPGVGRDTETGQRISWAEQADFEFRVALNESGERRLAGLKTATARGKTAMSVEDSTISADSLRAEFIDAGDDRTTLDHVFLNGAVSAANGPNRSLTSDAADMAFAPGEDPRRPDPTALTATGRVVARDGPSLARADLLHATLERQADGAVDVTWAELNGNAHFEQDDGVRPRVEADAAEIGVDPPKRIADLLAADGQAAVVKRGGAVLSGGQVRLDGLTNSAWVVGPGSFANGPDKRSPDGPAVTAAWTQEMKFDDTLGVLTASGEVTADVAADGLSLDKIRAERVRLQLTPGKGPSEGDSERSGLSTDLSDQTPGLDPSGGGRKLIHARAEGAIREVDGGANASVESWRFVAEKGTPGGRRPERVVFLEGPTIDASDEQAVLEVEGEGRLLVVDRRYFEGAAPQAGGGGLGSALTGGSVGGSLFSWRGSMRLDRASGTIRFLERVRLNHKSSRDASLLELECEDLTATVLERGSVADSKSEGVDGELESADARGAVWGRSAMRELIADRLFYNARTGVAEAAASEGNRVSVFDRARATVITASKLSWDLNRDRIEIVDPGSVTAPK